MAKKTVTCFSCGEDSKGELAKLHGYTICAACKSKMGLFKDETIKRYVESFEKARKKSPKKPTFDQEMRNRLVFLDKDYAKKKIKLLYVLERLEQIKKG